MWTRVCVRDAALATAAHATVAPCGRSAQQDIVGVRLVWMCFCVSASVLWCGWRNDDKNAAHVCRPWRALYLCHQRREIRDVDCGVQRGFYGARG